MAEMPEDAGGGPTITTIDYDTDKVLSDYTSILPGMTLGLCWLLSTANWLSQQTCRYFAAQLPRSLSNFTAIGALWTPISSVGNIPDFIIFHVWYCYYPEETRERSIDQKWFYLDQNPLTNWSRGKIAAILHAIFSDVFYWIKCHPF